MTGALPSPASHIVTPAITRPETQRLSPFLGEWYRVRVSDEDTVGTFGPLFEQFITAAAGEGADIPGPPRPAEIAAEHGIDIVGPPLAP